MSADIAQTGNICRHHEMSADIARLQMCANIYMVSCSVQVRSRFSPDTNQFGQIRADSRGMKAQSMLLMLQGRVGRRAKASADGVR